MEWLNSLWAWVVSLVASFVALFGFSEPVVQPETSVKAAEVFEALAAQVSPMLVDPSENEAPSNM